VKIWLPNFRIISKGTLKLILRRACPLLMRWTYCCIMDYVLFIYFCKVCYDYVVKGHNELIFLELYGLSFYFVFKGYLKKRKEMLR
jgi:hypothetical protein